MFNKTIRKQISLILFFLQDQSFNLSFSNHLLKTSMEILAGRSSIYIPLAKQSLSGKVVCPFQLVNKICCDINGAVKTKPSHLAYETSWISPAINGLIDVLVSHHHIQMLSYVWCWNSGTEKFSNVLCH